MDDQGLIPFLFEIFIEGVEERSLAALDHQLAEDSSNAEITRVDAITAELVIENGAITNVSGGHTGGQTLTFADVRQ